MTVVTDKDTTIEPTPKPKKMRRRRDGTEKASL